MGRCAKAGSHHQWKHVCMTPLGTSSKTSRTIAPSRSQAQLILVGAALLLILGMGMRQSFGLFLAPVTHDLAWTAAGGPKISNPIGMNTTTNGSQLFAPGRPRRPPLASWRSTLSDIYHYTHVRSSRRPRELNGAGRIGNWCSTHTLFPRYCEGPRQYLANGQSIRSPSS